MTEADVTPPATPTSPSSSPGPSAPGERRLERPPSDRFREAEPDDSPPPPGSIGRAVLYAAVAGLVAVVAMVVLGGVLAFSSGLLVVAAVTGRAIGLALQLGGRDAVPPRTRLALAVGLSIVAVALGQLGLWWYAGIEGGVLGPVDYLGETFGVLVPLQFALALGFAWWAAR